VPRLVPNPVGDIMKPLHQIEQAVTSLAHRLSPIESLPDVHAELVDVNQKLTALVEAMEGMRADMTRFYESQANGHDGAKPAAAARRTRSS
jgi:hypothetical protein